MLNGLIRWSIANRFVVIVLAVILFACGIYLSSNANIDVLPEFAPPQVVVETEAPGMVPEQIEALVSIPLESTLGGMPGVESIRSLSMNGVSVITVIFSYGTDIYRARQLVSERLVIAGSGLPRSVNQPQMAPLMPAIGDVLKVGLLCDKTSLMDLRTLADWDIKNRLLSVPGVARVLILGGDEKQYQVLIDPRKLKSFEVTLGEVARACEKSNLIGPGGYLVTPDQQLSIQGVARIRTIKDLENSVITIRENTPVLLKHVARVIVGPAFKLGDTSINGHPGVYR